MLGITEGDRRRLPPAVNKLSVALVGLIIRDNYVEVLMILYYLQKKLQR